jgi:hypothetical protein
MEEDHAPARIPRLALVEAGVAALTRIDCSVDSVRSVHRRSG